MKKLLEKIKHINEIIEKNNIQSLSFDIDGTLYPLRKVELRWWFLIFRKPFRTLKFLSIKMTWEKKRLGDERISILPGEIKFFEDFLVNQLLYRGLVPVEVRHWLISLKKSGRSIFFLSDHGAKAKIEIFQLSEFGACIDCLSETGELKPHIKIGNLLTENYKISSARHLHLGDRWSDKEQARIFGCSFEYFKH